MLGPASMVDQNQKKDNFSLLYTQCVMGSQRQRVIPFSMYLRISWGPSTDWVHIIYTIDPERDVETGTKSSLRTEKLGNMAECV